MLARSIDRYRSVRWSWLRSSTENPDLAALEPVRTTTASQQATGPDPN